MIAVLPHRIFLACAFAAALGSSPAFPASPESSEAVKAGAAQPQRVIEPYVVRVVGSYVDWSRGTAASWGRALDVRVTGRTDQTDQVKQAAQADARAKLVAYLGSLLVDSGRKLAEDPNLVAQAKQAVEGGFVIDEIERRGNFREMLWAVPFHGPYGLSRALMQVLMPDLVVPGEPPPMPARGTAPDGQPTGIIFDASGLGAAPVLFPRILDGAGEEIASAATVDKECRAAIGFSVYAWEAPAGSRPPDNEMSGVMSRLGDRPLRVKVSSTAGNLKGDLVLGEAEAALVRSTPGAADRLRQCAVVIMLDNPPSLLDTIKPPAPRKAPPPRRRRTPLDEPGSSPPGV